jgi:predicted dithiol-disulfide oxidoreductase (DUF899 family)
MITFPNESGEYRQARNDLLRAEIALRKQTEEVAKMRHALPPGGVVPQDYEFAEGDGNRVRLSQLFLREDASLVVYSFMLGPKMKAACPMCTAMLDSLDRTAPHATQRINLAVVAKSPIERIQAHARQRGWRSLRLLSSADNTYNRDYRGEDAEGAQLPALNVFVRRGSEIRHVYCTELLFAGPEAGQDPRHVDAIWPLWNLFDFTPEGRGSDWYPALEYPRT